MSFLDAPGGDSGISRDYSYGARSFSYNLNNKGFVKYLNDASSVLSKYEDQKSLKLKVDEFLKQENWDDLRNFGKVFKNHPVLPIVQSPKTVALRWCHADRAFLISKNGINFMQMKSREIEDGQLENSADVPVGKNTEERISDVRKELGLE